MKFVDYIEFIEWKEVKRRNKDVGDLGGHLARYSDGELTIHGAVGYLGSHTWNIVAFVKGPNSKNPQTKSKWFAAGPEEADKAKEAVLALIKQELENIDHD